MHAEPSRLTARQMMNKVPEITLYFWVIKVLCTTVGETASDYLAGNLNLGLTRRRSSPAHCSSSCSSRSFA